MAERKVYIGSVGPFLYDDAELVDDPDGDWAGETQEAFITDGQGKVGTTPSEDHHIVRLEDLGANAQAIIGQHIFGRREVWYSYGPLY